jgi:hypothetical protein
MLTGNDHSIILAGDAGVSRPTVKFYYNDIEITAVVKALLFSGARMKGPGRWTQERLQMFSARRG